MSKDSHLKAYIVGFILSLAFTAIPYYLVVNKTVQGNALIATILGFAVLQMLVQVIFFLHLGRSPQMRWQLGFFGGTVFGIITVVGGSIIIMNHLHRNMTPKDVADKAATDEAIYEVGGQQVGTCPGGTGKIYKVELKSDTAGPLHVTAKVCDSLMFINADSAAHDIQFGVRGQSGGTYAGETGSSIRPGRNLTVVLTEPGTYKFYDQQLSEITGDFTVAP